MIPFIILTVLVLAIILIRLRPVADNHALLEQHFPIWKVHEDCILSKSGDVTACFRLILPEIFSLSKQEYETLHASWLKAIRLLPPGCILHKQDWFRKVKYQGVGHDPSANGVAGRHPDLTDDFIYGSSERFFHERPYLDHDCLLFITLPAAGGALKRSAAGNLTSKSIIPKNANSGKQLQTLLETVGKFQKILTEGNLIELSKINSAEITGDGNTPGILERYLFLLEKSSDAVLKDLQFKPDFKIGHHYPQLFTLADAQHLPATCGPRINFEKYSAGGRKFPVGFAAPLGLLLPVNHIYNQYIQIQDTPKTLKRLEARRKRLQSLSAYSRENAISRDATSSYLNEAISESRLPVKAHFNLLAWTQEEDKMELKDIRASVFAAISQIGAVPYQERVQAPQIWWAGIPGNGAALPENEYFDSFSEQASCFFNLESAYRSSDSLFGIRLGDRLSGLPLHVDISDLPMKKGIITNRNKIVVGGSGSGKSMFMNHLLHSYVRQGAHCIVVDVGHSYEGLCQLLGGYYYTYTEQHPIAFNPFYVPPTEVLDTEKKESIKTLLVALWKQGDESFRRSEYVAISNALTGYYAYLENQAKIIRGNANEQTAALVNARHKAAAQQVKQCATGKSSEKNSQEEISEEQTSRAFKAKTTCGKDSLIFPCFDSFYEYLQTDFVAELQRDGVKDRDFDIHNFLYVLRPYYKGGEFDYLLNARENLDVMSQPFIVFELDNVKDHPILFPVITLIIMELFISKMRGLKGIRKVIVIEEAWKAIARSGMAEFMKYLYKTVRKYYGEAVTVTQEIDDIISSPIIKEAIINNADCKILLDMKKFQNKFESIQQVLGMTDKGRDLVLSINKANDPTKRYREVYIELGGQLMKVYRYEPSPEQYYAYSTEQSDKLLVQQYTAQCGGDIQKGLAKLIADINRKAK